MPDAHTYTYVQTPHAYLELREVEIQVVTLLLVVADRRPFAVPAIECLGQMHLDALADDTKEQRDARGVIVGIDRGACRGQLAAPLTIFKDVDPADGGLVVLTLWCKPSREIDEVYIIPHTLQ